MPKPLQVKLAEFEKTLLLMITFINMYEMKTNFTEIRLKKRKIIIEKSLEVMK